MKLLIHVGHDDARQTYEYLPGKLLNVEFGAMERVSGYIGEDLEDALKKGGINAMTALVWVLRKRQEPTLRFEQVVFNTEDLSTELVNDDGTPWVEPREGVEPTSNGAAAPKAPAGPAAQGGKKKSSSKRSHSAATTSSTPTGPSSPGS